MVKHAGRFSSYWFVNLEVQSNQKQLSRGQLLQPSLNCDGAFGALLLRAWALARCRYDQ